MRLDPGPDRKEGLSRVQPSAAEVLDMAKAKDPVCGMTVDTGRAAAHGKYGGQDVYFCSESCRRTYEASHKPD